MSGCIKCIKNRVRTNWRGDTPAKLKNAAAGTWTTLQVFTRKKKEDVPSKEMTYYPHHKDSNR